MWMKNEPVFEEINAPLLEVINAHMATGAMLHPEAAFVALSR